MTKREGILATIHRKHADRIPFVISRGMLPHGQIEHEARNKGMGVVYGGADMFSCMHTMTPHVKTKRTTVMTTKRKETRIELETPVGTLWMTAHDSKPFGGAYHHISGGPTEYYVKKPEDWEIVKYVVEDTSYEPYYERFDHFKRLIGDEGILITCLGYHTPYLSCLIGWAGAQRLYIHHFRYPEIVESVFEAMAKKQEEQYQIAVNAPADMIMYGDHIDGGFVSPPAFEKYVLPLHNKFARMAHAKGKITTIHCDGRLNVLKNQIAELEHDVIHAMTPPPVGDLPIKEALDIWKDKVLWINYEYYSMGPKALKKHLLELLRSIIPGYRVIIDASTERWPPPDCLQMLANIMSKATLPLTEEKIEKIGKSV